MPEGAKVWTGSLTLPEGWTMAWIGIEDGGITTTSTSQRPAMPPPAILARQSATRLAPYVVAEQLVATVAKAQAAHALATPAAAAVARHFSARVAELERRAE